MNNMNNEAQGVMSVRRRQDAEKQQARQKKSKIYGIIAIVVAVLVAALLIWDSGVIQRSAPAYTTGGTSFTATDVSYYYNNTYSNMASYAGYYGLDTSVSLKEQEITEGTTWYDYLMETSLATMDDVGVLLNQAKAAGYTLSADGQDEVQKSIDALDANAARSGVDRDTYLAYAYGRFMNSGAFKKAVTNQVLAQEYATYVADNFEITDADLNDYYAENKNSLDSYDYECYQVTLDLETEYDEEGNIKDFNADQLAASQARMEICADTLMEAMVADDADKVAELVEAYAAADMNGVSSASMPYYGFGEWVADEGRNPGDVAKVDYNRTDSNGDEYLYGYYVVKFNGRTLDEYNGIDFYNMLIQAAAQESEDGETTYDKDAVLDVVNGLVDEWQANGGSAEDFLAMAQENTDGSTVEYTNTAKGIQNPEVDEWLYAEHHDAGDYTILWDETLHGYRVVYVTGYNAQYYWQTQATISIQNDRYTAWLDAARAECAEPTQTFMMAYAE